MYLGGSHPINRKTLCVLCVSVSRGVGVRDRIRPIRGAGHGRSGAGPLPPVDGVAEAKAHATWPATLTQKWKIAVGSGYATPIVANGRVYIHARSGEQESITAYDAATGKPLWNDAHAFALQSEPGRCVSWARPQVIARSRQRTPLTLGISGILSRLDAASGKVIWCKQPSPEQPHFGVAMSPIVVDWLDIAFIGGA